MYIMNRLQMCKLDNSLASTYVDMFLNVHTRVFGVTIYQGYHVWKYCSKYIYEIKYYSSVME